MGKRRRGRPKEVKGTLTTCSFELTGAQTQWLTRRANACQVSRSAIVRTLVDAGRKAEELSGVPPANSDTAAEEPLNSDSDPE